ncbi:MAG: hypothetical protein ACYS0H_22615, partial [Planctomycetota bacterium]
LRHHCLEEGLPEDGGPQGGNPQAILIALRCGRVVVRLDPDRARKSSKRLFLNIRFAKARW